MIEDTMFPAPTHLLAVASCPEELLVPMGAMIGAFADHGVTVHAVLLSDGLPPNATAMARIEWNHRVVGAAVRLGIAEVIMLEHLAAHVPRTGVQLMTAEIVRSIDRVDAVLVADPADRRDRSARGRLAAFRAGLLTARAIGAQILVCTAVPPSPRARSHTMEVALSRAKQQSAIAYLNGVPEPSGRHRRSDDGVEYLLLQPQHEPSLSK
jgi:hypothetical protein